MKPARHRSNWLRCALLVSVASLAAPAIALAETAAAAEADAPAAEAPAAPGLAEVVVTAQKSTTNVQKTPISIAVVKANDLVNNHVVSLLDLGDGSIPSLRVAPFFARNSALTLGMRGIGALGDANQPARDQAVGIYVDGVYQGRAQGLGAALYDLDRIEVLKGPQGTLFGRNTEGGAISMISKQPSGQFRLNATAGYGDYNSYKTEGHLDLPASHDVSIKIDALLDKRSGLTNNPVSGHGQLDFDAYDKRGAHAEALWQPNDKFSADYAYDISYDGSTPFYVQLLAKGALALSPLEQIQTTRASTANFGVPLQYSEGNTSGHRLTLSWRPLQGLEVKSISSYRRLDESQYDNGEENLSAYAPNGNFSRYSLAHTYQSQYSEELQVVGHYSHIDFAAGGFYFHEAVRDNAQTPNTLQYNATGTAYTTLSVNLDTVSFDRADHVTSTSSGVYAQGTYTPPILNDITHLTVGGRFTHDAKQGDLDLVNGAIPVYVNTAGKTITGIIPLDKAWDRFDPLVNLSVDLTQDVHAYGKWSTGYKAGGANSRSLTYRPFDPETVSMVEIGAKTEFWDRRARFNVAIYDGDLKDVQVDFNVIIVGNNRGTLETTNAATGKTRGVEADVALNPITGVTLTASYAYTDVAISNAFNPFTNGQSPVYPLYTPKNAGSVGGDYERPLGFATLRGHLDANFAGGQYTSTTDPTVSDTSVLVNGRIALADMRMADGALLQVSLWSRNLLNEQHAFLKNTNSSLGVYGIFNEPRTFGVEGNVKF